MRIAREEIDPLKTIAIYGSATVQPHEEDYTAAYTVGRILGQAGYTVMTGGYRGVMEAASQGAHDAGAHVVGITCTQIESIRPGKANTWVKEEICYTTLSERLNHLILKADGYIAMPGGVGTLNELVMVWELMRVHEIPLRPIACYGRYWQSKLSEFIESPYIPAESRAIIRFFDAPEALIDILKNGA